MKHGVAVDGETQLMVELDNPVSVEVAVSLKITARNKDSENVILREPTISWKAGETGIKHFTVLHKGRHQNRRKPMQFVGMLHNAVHCSIDNRHENMTLVVIENEEFPVFRSPLLQVPTIYCTF